VTEEHLAATQASYDAVAAAYADQLSDELRRKPLDRALLTAFAEQLQAATSRRGSGPTGVARFVTFRPICPAEASQWPRCAPRHRNRPDGTSGRL
jgi:hypothetical protein